MKTSPRSPHRPGLLLLALLFAATAGLRAAALAPTAPAPATPAVAPAAPSNGIDPSYVFAGTDTLAVVVYGEDDLSVSTRVDATGQVNLPLVGKVKILGLTVSEAQKVVEKTYQDQRYLRRPQVTINILSIAQRQVSIQGEVKIPTSYAILAEVPMSVVDLVIKAGGFTPEANGKMVRITHINREGKPETRTVDVKSIIDGTSKTKPDDETLLLQPNDIVYVPISWF